MSEHTELPWNITDQGTRLVMSGAKEVSVTIVCWSTNDEKNLEDDEAEANAEFIVKACNNHYQLLGALKELTYNYGSEIPLSLENANAVIEQAEE